MRLDHFAVLAASDNLFALKAVLVVMTRMLSPHFLRRRDDWVKLTYISVMEAKQGQALARTCGTRRFTAGHVPVVSSSV